MALKNLLKSLSRGESYQIGPVWDKFLEDKNTGETRAPGRFHPSSISRFSCPRELLYKFIGVTISNKIPAETLRIFWVGSVIHEALQDNLLKSGALKQAEVKAKDEDYLLSGSADGISADGKELLEFKTINQENFRMLNAPKEAHIDQIHLYLYMLQLRLAKIIYFNKNTSEMKEYAVTYSINILMPLLNLIKQVREAAEQKNLLERVSKNKSDKPCKYCNYRDFCWTNTTFPEMVPCQNMTNKVKQEKQEVGL